MVLIMGRKQAWYVLEIRLIRHQVRGIFQLLSSSTASNKINILAITTSIRALQAMMK